MNSMNKQMEAEMFNGEVLGNHIQMWHKDESKKTMVSGIKMEWDEDEILKGILGNEIS